MKGHGTVSTADRAAAVDDVRQEIQGKPPRGPFEFAADLSFDSVKPGDGAGAAEVAFRNALRRDARYASAGAVYLRAFGLSQALPELYNGSKQLQDGGVA